MNIRIQESNGIKKYFINGVEYNRLDDIPEEFRHHFVDRDNNGIPDQFDSIVELAKNPFGFKELVSGLKTRNASPVIKNQNASSVTPEKGSVLVILIKIVIAIALAFLIARFYLAH